MVITEATPAPAASRRNHLLCGARRRKIHDTQYHAANRHSRVPRPIMMSHDRCTTFTSEIVGSSAAGSMLRPFTTVLVPVFGSDRIEASPGMGMPPLTVPLLLRCPNRVSGTSLVV